MKWTFFVSSNQPDLYPNLESNFGMLWRYAPMSDQFVDEWHSRDLDSTIIQREVGRDHRQTM